MSEEGVVPGTDMLIGAGYPRTRLHPFPITRQGAVAIGIAPHRARAGVQRMKAGVGVRVERGKQPRVPHCG